MAIASELRRIRIFLSSPGDVAAEREIIKKLVDKLNEEFSNNPLLEDENLSIKVIAWEDASYAQPVLLTPQEAINQGLPKPSECDIVLVIFWGRMGTPLDTAIYKKLDHSPYLSGTEWEYLNAVDGSKKNEGGLPLIHLYWRTDKPPVPGKDEDEKSKRELDELEEYLTQRRHVDNFFSQFRESPTGPFKGSVKAYKGLTAFEEMLQKDLNALIKRVIAPKKALETTSPSIELGQLMRLINKSSPTLSETGLKNNAPEIDNLLQLQLEQIALQVEKHEDWGQIEKSLSNLRRAVEKRQAISVTVEAKATAFRQQWDAKEREIASQREFEFYKDFTVFVVASLARVESDYNKHHNWNKTATELQELEQKIHNAQSRSVQTLTTQVKSTYDKLYEQHTQRLKAERWRKRFITVGAAVFLGSSSIIGAGFLFNTQSDDSSQTTITPSITTTASLSTEVAIAPSETVTASPTSSESPTESPSPTNTESPTTPPSPSTTPSATETPSHTPTPSPSETPSPTLTATITPQPNSTLADGLGLQPINTNTDWTPVIQEFDGVLMALVPIGCFTMGSIGGQSDEQNGNWVCFDKPFWIDVNEVTQGDFTRQNGLPLLGNDEDGNKRQFEFPARHRPVENISWYEARLFCESRRGGRLPTEAEWEYAARGPSNWVYPWGNEWIEENGHAIWTDNANFTTAVVGRSRQELVWENGRYAGASWVGALDMAGNVTEWTLSQYRPYPYDPDDGREDIVIDNNILRVVRGGAWTQGAMELRASDRDRHLPNNWATTRGFRCVLDYQP